MRASNHAGQSTVGLQPTTGDIEADLHQLAHEDTSLEQLTSSLAHAHPGHIAQGTKEGTDLFWKDQSSRTDLTSRLLAKLALNDDAKHTLFSVPPMSEDDLIVYWESLVADLMSRMSDDERREVAKIAHEESHQMHLVSSNAPLGQSGR